MVFENVTAKEPADFQGLDALTNLGFPEEIWQAVEDGYPVLKLEEQKNPDGGEEDTTAPTTTEPTPTTTEPTPGGDSDGEPTQPADSEDAGTSTPADDEKGCKSSLPAAMVCLLLVGFGTAALCLHKRGNKAH